MREVNRQVKGGSYTYIISHKKENAVENCQFRPYVCNRCGLMFQLSKFICPEYIHIKGSNLISN